MNDPFNIKKTIQQNNIVLIFHEKTIVFKQLKRFLNYDVISFLQHTYYITHHILFVLQFHF